MPKRKCVDCFESSQVIDSRYVNGYVRRRRRCLKCNGRFTTTEIRAEELSVLRSVALVPKEVTGLLEEALNKLKGDIDGKEVTRD